MQKLRVACLFICLLSSVACTALHDEHISSSSANLHAIQDERLRNLMRELNSLMFERMRTELELDLDRRQKALQIGRVAAEMEETVGDIIDFLPQLSLNENDQTSYLTLAEKLRNQVKTVKLLADQNHIDAIPGALQRMKTTCTMCHHLFRKAVEKRKD